MARPRTRAAKRTSKSIHLPSEERLLVKVIRERPTTRVSKRLQRGIGTLARLRTGLEASPSFSSQAVGGSSTSNRAGGFQFLTAIEVLIFFACVLLDIWRWQYTRPHLWILLAVGMVLTHIFHRDTWRTLGITRS